MYIGLYVCIWICVETEQNLPENFLQRNQNSGAVAVPCNQDHTRYSVMILERPPKCPPTTAKINLLFNH